MEVKGLVQAFFGRYGEAMGSGDVDSAASCWGVPALLLSDDGVRAVVDEEEVRALLRATLERRRSRGLEATHPASVRTSQTSSLVLVAEVEWISLDGAGAERSREGATYLLRLDDAGGPRIHASVSATADASAGGEAEGAPERDVG